MSLESAILIRQLGYYKSAKSSGSTPRLLKNGTFNGH